MPYSFIIAQTRIIFTCNMRSVNEGWRNVQEHEYEQLNEERKHDHKNATEGKMETKWKIIKGF